MSDESWIASLGGALGLWAVASWLTHIIFCFSVGKWGFLIAGAIFFPIALAHGTYLWFN